LKNYFIYEMHCDQLTNVPENEQDTNKAKPNGRVFIKNLFNGEVAIVTGGGTGIGREIARELAFLGAKVAICGRRLEPLQQTVEELRKDLQHEQQQKKQTEASKNQSQKQEEEEIEKERSESESEREEDNGIYYQSCDIRNYDQVKQFVEHVHKRFGPITILVNSAGGQFMISSRYLSTKGFNAVVQNNLIGTWNMIHACAITSMIPNKKGRVVTITAQIKRGFPGMIHTGAARAAIQNMTKTLAVEWSPYNILLNCVAPGVIRPSESGTHRYPKETLEKARLNTPLRRLGLGREVAHLVTYLCSPMASFITGQIYYIDGGQSLWGDFSDPYQMAKL
jgi:NAD(P)-dependent dehydrogenase (short-subunit alcohol dehydrogenase family)